MTMFGNHIGKRLAGYIDGELTQAGSNSVESHLARCPHCRRELDQVRLGMAIVEHLPLETPPDALWTSIERALYDVRPGRTFPVGRWRLAAAAFVMVVTAGVYWRWAAQPKADWEVTRLAGSPVVAAKQLRAAGTIGVGEWIETDALSRARIKVGEIGSVDVEPNTRVRLLAANSAEHRLALGNGQITAKILAPPRLFFVQTPAGTAVDLGCEYKLECNRDGFGLLRVMAGWVSFEWMGRESLVPAGAVCRTRPRKGPGTPYFDDASERLVRALESFDFESAGSSAVSTILAESRVRDTLTLWHLLSRVESGERARVYDRMAGLSPLPAGISRERVLALNKDTLRIWKEELAWTW
jgi:hypothetical protein